MGPEPATSSLGKRYYFVYQGFGDVPCAWSAMVCTEFPQNECEWSHNGVTEISIPSPTGVHQPAWYLRQTKPRCSVRGSAARLVLRR